MQVKVWNDNTLLFDDPLLFRDMKITIPSKQYIEMNIEDATDYLGRYFPMKMGGDSRQDPASYKMLRIERPKKTVDDIAFEKSISFGCHSCGEKFMSQRSLDDHTDIRHLDELADQKVAEKRRGRPRKEAL